MNIDELKKIIQDCGVVGAGGAGFPTHIKIDSRAKTILLNCAECEPLINVDKYLLTSFTNEILSMLSKLSEILDADVVIAVKNTYKNTIEAVNKNLSDYPRFKLSLLEPIYPTGDEVLLLYETMGIVVPPGALPIDIGCVVFNVETMYNIYKATTYGKTVSEKWVTIAGEVKNPGIKQLPLGITVKEAVEMANTTIDNPEYIINGLMMGKTASSEDVITKTTNAIFVLPYFLHKQPDTCTSLKRAASACCQCRNCTDMCPRFLIGYPIEPHRIMRALCTKDLALDPIINAMYCSSCGVCEVAACPQSLAPRTLIGKIKSELKKAGVIPAKHDFPKISPLRQYRKIDQERLKIRLGISKYEVHE